MAHVEPFVCGPPLVARCLQLARGHSGGAVFGREQDLEMLSNDLFSAVVATLPAPEFHESMVPSLDIVKIA